MEILMQLPECVVPFLNCMSQHVGVMGVAMGGVFAVMGVARTIMKPLQPVIKAMLDLGPLKKYQWDNKVVNGAYWFLDYFFSLKLKNPKEKNEDK